MCWPGADAEPVVEDVPLPDLGTRADDREVVELAAGAELGVVADDRADDARAARRRVVRAPTTAFSTTPPSREARAGAEHGEAAEARALLDDRSGPDVHGRDELRARVHVRGLVDEREVGAERIADLRLEDALEHVAMRLQVRLGRADVEPVARAGRSRRRSPPRRAVGKTSRSIETARPGGTSSSTSGSRT